MNTVSLMKKSLGGKAGATIALSSLLLTACAMAPETPPAALDVREKLTAMQRNPEMASNESSMGRQQNRRVEVTIEN